MRTGRETPAEYIEPIDPEEAPSTIEEVPTPVEAPEREKVDA